MAVIPPDAPLDGSRAALLPAAEDLVYLNTGSAGPLLAPVAAAMTAELEQELRAGRADAAGWTHFLESRQGLRDALADLVNAHADEIVLTHHTTEGLNIALWGMEWQRGDRVLMSSLEHDAGIAAVHSLVRRFGLRLEIVEVGSGARDEVIAGFEAALATPAALVVVSHVAYQTGAVLPIAEISQRAHAGGGAVLVDGAQAVGAIDVDVHASGADFYSFNGYKWLCGPEGSGALVVRRPWLEWLAPSHWGAFGVAGPLVPADPAATVPAPGAARYESGSWFRPQLAGLAVAAAVHRSRVSGGGGPVHVDALARDLISRVRAMGARVTTPDNGPLAGLVAFRFDGHDSAALAAALERRGIIVRSVPSGDLRVSCGSFTETRDLDALCAALTELRATS